MPQGKDDGTAASEGMSLRDREDAIRSALVAAYGDETWVKDVFDGHVVYELRGALFADGYTMGDDGAISLNNDVQPVARVTNYKTAGGTFIEQYEKRQTSGRGEPEEITEFVTSRGASLKVDHNGGVIRGVKVIGLESKNGRRYPKATLEAALEMYHEARVNVNHPEGKSDQPRRYQDRLGMIRDPKLRADGIFGDLYYNPKHPLAEQLEWDANNSPESVGLSHNISGRVRRENGTVVVEEISRVVSVDLVADPATTRGLFEHFESTGEVDMTKEFNLQEVTIDQLRKEAPDLVKALVAEAIAEHGNSTELEQANAKVSRLEVENTTLKTKLANVTEERDALATEKKAKKTHDAIEAVLTAAKLPKEILTEDIRKEAHSRDVESAKAYIATLEGAVQRAASKPTSVEQMLAEGKGHEKKITDGKTLASAISE